MIEKQYHNTLFFVVLRMEVRDKMKLMTLWTKSKRVWNRLWWLWSSLISCMKRSGKKMKMSSWGIPSFLSLKLYKVPGRIHLKLQKVPGRIDFRGKRWGGFSRIIACHLLANFLVACLPFACPYKEILHSMLCWNGWSNSPPPPPLPSDCLRIQTGYNSLSSLVLS